VKLHAFELATADIREACAPRISADGRRGALVG
jgi:hypothetical protein